MPEEPSDLLIKARRCAERLLKELETRQAEIEANPPALPPEKLAEGRAAMCQAIAAANRTLAALEDALKIAQDSSFESDS